MSTKNYKTGVMLGLVWGGVGGCRGLFWTGILGGRRGGGVRIGVWAPRIIKLGLCRGGVGFGLGYWGVGTKNYKTGVENYFGLGYLGDAGEEVFEGKCGPQKL